MDYFNPFSKNNPMTSFQNQKQGQIHQQIDPQQFCQFAVTLNDTALNNFAQMARAQGISEQDIMQGIQFIKSL